MLYCEKCMKLREGEHCPSCRKSKLREPGNNDPVFVLSADAFFAASVEDILEKEGIPCLKKGFLGAGITTQIGNAREIYDICVPFGAYECARELLRNFTEDQE